MRAGTYQLNEFRPKWDFDADPDHRAGKINRAFLSSKTLGFTLNVCCGTDRTGDVLVDVDPKLHPHVLADVKHLPFRNRAFETVICDPPFSMFNRFKWTGELLRLAQKRIILSTPAICLRFPNDWDREVFFTDSGRFFMRIWQVFTKGTSCLVEALAV
jgi:hypothetical protein